MANKKSIQILRGTENYDPSTSEEILIDGQPFYSKKTRQLYIGDGNEIKDTKPTGAAYLLPGNNPDNRPNVNMWSNVTGDFKSGPNSLKYRVNTQIEDKDNRFNPDATGNGAVALGIGNLAAGNSSFVQGKRNYAGANQTICLGQGNIALGKYSAAFNESNLVTERSSSVFGSENINFGHSSVVSGYMNISGGHASLVSGRNNIEAYYCYDTQDNKLWITYKNFNSSSINLNEDEDLLIPNTTGNLMTDLSSGLDGLKVTIDNKQYNLGIGLDTDYTGNNWVIKNKNSSGELEDLTIYVKSVNERYVAFSLPFSNNTKIPYNNIIAGRNNGIGHTTYSTLVVGNNDLLTNVKNSVVSGSYNKVVGSHHAIFGYNNNVTGGYNFASGNNIEILTGNCSGAIGSYLTVGRDTSFVVGTYNSPSSNAIFQVGIGTSTTNRKNAFSVTSSGAVTISKVPGSAYEVLRYNDLIPINGNTSTTNGFDIKVNSIKLNTLESNAFKITPTNVIEFNNNIQIKPSENCIDPSIAFYTSNAANDFVSTTKITKTQISNQIFKASTDFNNDGTNKYKFSIFGKVGNGPTPEFDCAAVSTFSAKSTYTNEVYFQKYNSNNGNAYSNKSHFENGKLSFFRDPTATNANFIQINLDSIDLGTCTTSGGKINSITDTTTIITKDSVTSPSFIGNLNGTADVATMDLQGNLIHDYYAPKNSTFGGSVVYGELVGDTLYLNI